MVKGSSNGERKRDRNREKEMGFNYIVNCEFSLPTNHRMFQQLISIIHHCSVDAL